MRLSFALLVAALAGTSSAGSAQTEVDTGTHIAVPRRAQIPGDRNKEVSSRIVMREFARCTYATYPKKVADAVMLAPGSEAEALSKISNGDCLDSGTIKFGASIMRGALFGEMYRRHQRDIEAWTLPAQPLTLSEVPASDAPTAVRGNFLMLYLAQCIHGTAPGPMREVVIQPVASQSQEKAFDAIIPLLGGCLPEGMTLTLNRLTLENAFAEYLYRSAASSAAVAGNS